MRLALTRRRLLLMAHIVDRHRDDRADVLQKLASSLQRMLEGFVLQNVLLLRDIGAVSGTFRDLVVIFDTRFLFGALGLTGLSIQQAARELLDLLKATGARLSVFEPTVAG